MIPQFDIFMIEPDGSTRWCEAANTLEEAKKRLDVLAKLSRARQFIIFNQQTGEKLLFEGRTATSSTEEGTLSPSAKHGQYHICRVDKEKLRWIEAAETLQVAEARIKVLKALEPGDYLVLDYNPEHSDSPAPWTPLSFVLSAFSL